MECIIDAERRLLLQDRSEHSNRIRSVICGDEKDASDEIIDQ